MAYRCHRAIGDSWTERLHADVAALTATWATQAGWPSPRTCPLCQSGPGTPRHVIMSCKALAPAADMLRDDIEAELQSLASAVMMHSARQPRPGSIRLALTPSRISAQHKTPCAGPSSLHGAGLWFSPGVNPFSLLMSMVAVSRAQAASAGQIWLIVRCCP